MGLYLGHLIIDRKKRSRDFWLMRAEMGQRTCPKKIRENSMKENHRFSKNERPRMSQPEGIAKNDIIRDYAKLLSTGPSEIKKIGIALRMHFQDTFISETELSTKK